MLLDLAFGLLALALLAFLFVGLAATICLASCWTIDRAADAVLGSERDV